MTGDLSTLPAPPYPDETDLSHLPAMMLNIQKLLASRLWRQARREPDLAFYALNMWMASWHEVPAATLEDDDDLLCDVAQCDPERWPAVRDKVKRLWYKCRNGRLYHTYLSDVVLDAVARTDKEASDRRRHAGEQKRYRNRLQQTRRAHARVANGNGADLPYFPEPPDEPGAALDVASAHPRVNGHAIESSVSGLNLDEDAGEPCAPRDAHVSPLKGREENGMEVPGTSVHPFPAPASAEHDADSGDDFSSSPEQDPFVAEPEPRPPAPKTFRHLRRSDDNWPRWSCYTREFSPSEKHMGQSLPIVGTLAMRNRVYLPTAIEEVCKAAGIYDPDFRTDWSVLVKWFNSGAVLEDNILPVIREQVADEKEKMRREGKRFEGVWSLWWFNDRVMRGLGKPRGTLAA